MDSREKLLKDIMAIDFALVDMNLYLNTHPYDQRAIMIFNHYVCISRALRDNYQRCYGPLTAATFSNCPWQWIDEPWPWQ